MSEAHKFFLLVTNLRSLVILSALLLCNLVAWVNIFWPTEAVRTRLNLTHDLTLIFGLQGNPVAYFGKSNKLSFYLDNIEGDSSALLLLAVSLACVGYYCLSAAYKNKIRDANRYYNHMSQVLDRIINSP